MTPDFSGWATKNGLKCSDGRTILKDAFKHNDKKTVPLVWQHRTDAPSNVLGHAVLENRTEGVYAYAFFNGSEPAQHVKELVSHGDINMLSIHANNLTEKNKLVSHGNILELSVVIAGANPGAFIDNVNIQHGDGYETLDDEAIIYTGLEIEHEDLPDNSSEEDEDKEEIEHEDSDEDDEKTVKDVFDSLSEEQKNVVHYMLAAAVEAAQDEDDDKDDKNDDGNAQHSDVDNKEGTAMTRNVFEQNGVTVKERPTLTHDQLKTIVDDAKELGSFKESFLKHVVDYGIENIELLFPDYKNTDNAPEWIKRQTEWVSGILNGVRRTPFSRIRSLSADITHEEARARGYIKGNLKKEEFFAIAKRETTPKTIYKKQKLDRDDIVDITDLDVVAWLKAEMRLMLEEEVARAILFGDGRPVEDPSNPGEPNPDKIDETKIRPIATDDEFYTHRIDVPANVSGNTLLETVLRQRKNYKGKGRPAFYTTEDVITDLLLLKDQLGRRYYADEQALAVALRVSSIIPVEAMEGVVDSDGHFLIGILVNIGDYTVGTNPGGQTSFFDDFDIDYNQYKYLYETRFSGALTRHKTAQAIWRAQGILAEPTEPTFNSGTNTITIPSVTGVVYSIDGTPVTGTEVIEADTIVTAAPAEGYYFASGTTTSWEFSYND